MPSAVEIRQCSETNIGKSLMCWISRFTATSTEIPGEILGLEWEADACLVLAHRIRSEQQLEKARSNRSHLMGEGA